MKQIAILTCGRSDFSILYPLIDALKKNDVFSVTVIAYSTHLSVKHGRTIEDIQNLYFGDLVQLETLVDDYSIYGVAQSFSKTVNLFSEFWNKRCFDWILALGDRYEIFAALAASVPYGINIAHLHGGEKTLGADDNKYRHAITALSTIHFTSCSEHQKRVRDILDDEFFDTVFNVGSLALHEANFAGIFNSFTFKQRFGIDLDERTVLVTLHPETIRPENDQKNILLLTNLIASYDYQYLVTLPNNDAGSNFLRSSLLELEEANPRVTCREYLGRDGYFSAMKHSIFMFGNSSSALIEAASFGKYAINVGYRQEGRIRNKNVLDANSIDEVNDAVELFKTNVRFEGENKFFKPDGVYEIVQILSGYN